MAFVHRSFKISCQLAIFLGSFGCLPDTSSPKNGAVRDRGEGPKAQTGEVVVRRQAQGEEVKEPAFVPERSVECEVIVAGGSTAALAAALASARENKTTCLLEPTDWAGGQLTSSAVSAIDFGHHKVRLSPNAAETDFAPAGRAPVNQSQDFVRLLSTVGYREGVRLDTCWVSVTCYEPLSLLQKGILPAIKEHPKLLVFYNTMVKNVSTTQERAIASVLGVTRTAKSGSGYERFFSQDVTDWYSPVESAFFSKSVVEFKGPDGKLPVVVDATEFGDVLVLSGATYLQGSEKSEAEPLSGSHDTCGQATVYPFVMGASRNPPAQNLPMVNPILPGFYSVGTHGYQKIWSYRRIKKGSTVLDSQADPFHAMREGDLSLQNWNPGNDFPGGYLFLSKQETARQTENWAGGLNVKTLADAEQHALGWYFWLKGQMGSMSSRVFLKTDVLGTSHGLSRMPYVRDTRRSVGIGDFVLRYSDLVQPSVGSVVATVFSDTVALGFYEADIHPLKTCNEQPSTGGKKTVPFFIPYRALTNKDIPNLLVAGKTMSQTYLANSGVRLHPIEWSTGLAAGVAASVLLDKSLRTEGLMDELPELRARLQKHGQPLRWTIGSQTYPAR